MSPATGIVFDIQRFSLHDGPGIRTTVFLKGCPLRCAWCHNPESWLPEPQMMIKNGQERICGSIMTVEKVMTEVIADEAYYRNSGGGLTVSGGEPMLQFPFLKALLKSAGEQGLHTCLETSGYCRSDQIKGIIPLADLFLFDIKLLDEEVHKQYTGVGNTLILKNLDLLHHSGAKIILRCPIIPGINDTDAHITSVAQLAERYPNISGVEIMPYHDMGKGKWRELGKEYSFGELKTMGQEDKQALLYRFSKKVNCQVTI